MNQSFAGYSITRSVSGGGMTKLYVAIDAQQERYVIRVLDAMTAKDRKARARFFHGGEILAKLQQGRPDIVPFVKQGYEGKVPYMVLKYIDSRTLRDLILYRDPLLTDNVVVFIKQLAVVIQYVHTQNRYNILQLLVALQQLFHTLSRLVVSLANHFGGQDARC